MQLKMELIPRVQMGMIEMADKKNFIQGAIKKPGVLRKSLGIKKGKTIPVKTLAKAANKPGKLGRRARLAETLKKLRKKK